jgi:putative membrane protein
MDAADLQIPALRSMSGSKAIAAILGVSAAVFLFLVWLIYFKPATGYSSEAIGLLPAVNATLNALSSAFLITAFVAVKQRRYASHIRWVFAAVASSTLFLISYVVYHNFHGDTKFTGQGLVRRIYFFILISHIVLSAVVVPLILTTLYLALAGRLHVHRRVARYTFPIWLYVSITGVLIFAMLKLFSS